ncbi:MAG: antitoxin [Candidatus Altiarchaeales archaeon]|nr:MAG: antitoxin [Candidatus Altiarchaeales archaeon]
MEVECVYEKGLIKPLKKVKLKEGEKIKVKVIEDLDDILNRYSSLLKSTMSRDKIRKYVFEYKTWKE